MASGFWGVTSPWNSAIDRISYAFRLCLARPPKPEEVRLLERVYQRELARFQADPTTARTFLQGQKVPPGMDATQLAAWYHVAAVLLNLDEMITKG